MSDAQQAIYLDSGGGTFAMLHPAAPGAGAAVLIVPPFGWDDIASYRVRRDWAQQLAAAGHPALRIDLPGTGDSAGGPGDRDVVGRWVNAIADAATWLRATAGRDRVAIIGLGLGGLLSLAAADRGAPVDDLVLWGAPGRGRTAVRELRAFARLGEGAAVPTPPELGVVVNGHALRPATIEALGALDADALRLPAGLRALVLERDGIAPDARLLAALEGAGVTAETAAGEGWGAMLDRPQAAVPPLAVFGRVAAWLARAPAGPERAAPSAAPVGTADELVLAGGVIERPVIDATPAGETFGILTRPAGEGPPRRMVVMLNAGAIRRIGPNRMYVEAARRWAAHGIASLRLDVAGIGDAEGDGRRFADDAGFHDEELREQVEAVLGALPAGVPETGGPTLLGLCSGAHWAFQTALRSAAVERIILLNPRALFWADDLGAARDLRYYLARARDPRTWRRAVRGEISLGYLRRNAPAMLRRLAGAPLRLVARLRAARADGGGDRIDRAFDQISAQGTEVLMVFTAEEPLYAELEHDGRLPRLAATPGIEVRRLGDIAAHTLQPAVLQADVHRLLDAELGLEQEAA